MENLSKLTEYIGNTPLVQVGENPKLMAKMGSLNPSGSMKDRIAKQAVREAKELGCEAIVEPSTGNTGIAISMAAAAEGIDAFICVPTNPNKKKVGLMEHYGAEVFEAPEDKTYREKAEEIAHHPDIYYFNQYKHKESNPHTLTTAKEIEEQVGEELSHFVASIGSGGTITGVSKGLAEDVTVIGVDAEKSNLTEIFEGEDYEEQKSDIEGVGRHYQSDILDFDYVDEVQEVSRGDCVEASKELGSEYGISAGLSSGAVYTVLKRIDEADTAVGMFADSASRYPEELL